MTRKIRSDKKTYTPESALARDRAYFWPNVNKRGGYVDFADPLVRVTKADGECWSWTASRQVTGYGIFRSAVFGGPTTGHRVAFFMEYGVKSTMTEPLDHLCRNTSCVRPGHLEHVTMRVNVARGAGPTAINAAKTHCIYGHEFTPENTKANGDGRKCSECHRRISLEWLHRNNGKAAA